MQNAIELILSKTNEIFEQGWLKELQLLEELKGHANAHRLLAIETRSIGNVLKFTTFNGTDYKASASTLFGLIQTGHSLGNAIKYGCLSSMLRGSSLNKATQLASIYNASENDDKWSKFLEREKSEHKLFLESKLKQVINEKLQGFEYEDGIIPLITICPKGYEISLPVIKDNVFYLFYTTCYGAGGYNIQRFHYKYRPSLEIIKNANLFSSMNKTCFDNESSIN